MRVLFVSTYLAQEPLGVMYLSTALKAAGHETKMLFVPDPTFPVKLKAYDPGVVCYSFTTGVHQAVAGLNAIVKKILPNVVSLAGGPHVTVVPEFMDEGHFDAICRGEGEEAIVEFVTAIERGEDPSKIQNIWYRDAAGTVHKNELRPLVQDLDGIGFCDRSLVYDGSNIYRNSDRKVIKTDRGCPMNCSFCFHHAWKTKVYQISNNEYVRRRSVDHVIREALAIKEQYPLGFVHFLDDIFNVNNRWLEEFADRWPVEVGLPFDAILMANMVTEKHTRLLKKAGCVYARIAFEAADDHMRNAVMRKNTTRTQLVRAARLIREAGLRLGSLNMLGGPGSSIDDELETVKLNIECAVDHPLCSLLQPYPLTDINDMTKEMGVAMDEWDEFPALFNRTTSIARPDRHHFENLHKWFPIVVRHPKLMPLATRAIRWKWLCRPYTWMYMLYSEWLVTEQNELVRGSQGKQSGSFWRAQDYFRRVVTKGCLRMVTFVAGRGAAKLTARMKIGDERTVSHQE